VLDPFRGPCPPNLGLLRFGAAQHSGGLATPRRLHGLRATLWAGGPVFVLSNCREQYKTQPGAVRNAPFLSYPGQGAVTTAGGRPGQPDDGFFERPALARDRFGGLGGVNGSAIRTPACGREDCQNPFRVLCRRDQHPRVASCLATPGCRIVSLQDTGHCWLRVHLGRWVTSRQSLIADCYCATQHRGRSWTPTWEATLCRTAPVGGERIAKTPAGNGDAGSASQSSSFLATLGFKLGSLRDAPACK
jgi:hypothetical protein